MEVANTNDVYVTSQRPQESPERWPAAVVAGALALFFLSACGPHRPAMSRADERDATTQVQVSDLPTPHFERSDEPAIEVDTVNAHGG